MEDKSKEISTYELWAKLFDAEGIDRFLNEQVDKLPPFSNYLSDLCEARGEVPEQVIRRSDLESSFGHRLFAGSRKPSRDSVLKLAFGLSMTVEEAQQFLKIARVTALHPKVRRDAVIAWCLHRGKNLIQTQEILHDEGLPLLGGEKHG